MLKTGKLKRVGKPKPRTRTTNVKKSQAAALRDRLSNGRFAKKGDTVTGASTRKSDNVTTAKAKVKGRSQMSKDLKQLNRKLFGFDMASIKKGIQSSTDRVKKATINAFLDAGVGSVPAAVATTIANKAGSRFAHAALAATSLAAFGTFTPEIVGVTNRVSGTYNDAKKRRDKAKLNDKK